MTRSTRWRASVQRSRSASCMRGAIPRTSNEAAAAVRARLPDAYVTTSSDVLPQIKEFERFSTTVANAAVGPVIQNYLGRLQGRLHEAGYDGELLVILSHGGVASVEEATRLAAGTALSGPAAASRRRVALSPDGDGSECHWLRHGRHLDRHRRGTRWAATAVWRQGGRDGADCAAEPGYRDVGGGWRVDREAGPVGPAGGRAGERRAGAGPGLLRPRRLCRRR